MSHPRAVGESYLEHMEPALSFSAALLVASLACGVHVFAPTLFVRTGSKAVTRLHARIVTGLTSKIPKTAGGAEPVQQPWADYAI